jgi:heme oxygenase
MYVLERATPLHGIVREHLTTRLPRLHGATSYLSNYEGSIGSRWLELGDALERVSAQPGAIDRIVLAAFDGFRCAIDWYQGNRSPDMRRVG